MFEVVSDAEFLSRRKVLCEIFAVEGLEGLAARCSAGEPWLLMILHDLLALHVSPYLSPGGCQYG